MFFTKHDAKKCPNCSFVKAHAKRNLEKEELLCYYCGYYMVNEKYQPCSTYQPHLVIFRQAMDEKEYPLVTSDIEWFINEYILDGKEYLELEGYRLFFYPKMEEHRIKALVDGARMDVYHYAVAMQDDGSFHCISCGMGLKALLPHITTLFK